MYIIQRIYHHQNTLGIMQLQILIVIALGGGHGATPIGSHPITVVDQLNIMLMIALFGFPLKLTLFVVCDLQYYCSDTHESHTKQWSQQYRQPLKGDSGGVLLPFLVSLDS